MKGSHCAPSQLWIFIWGQNMHFYKQPLFPPGVFAQTATISWHVSLDILWIFFCSDRQLTANSHIQDWKDNSWQFVLETFMLSSNGIKKETTRDKKKEYFDNLKAPLRGNRMIFIFGWNVWIMYLCTGTGQPDQTCPFIIIHIHPFLQG